MKHCPKNEIWSHLRKKSLTKNFIFCILKPEKSSKKKLAHSYIYHTFSYFHVEDICQDSTEKSAEKTYEEVLLKRLTFLISESQRSRNYL